MIIHDVEYSINRYVENKNKLRLTFMNGNASGRPVGPGEVQKTPANMRPIDRFFRARVIMNLKFVFFKLFRLRIIRFSVCCRVTMNYA